MNDMQRETPAVSADTPDWTRERPRALWDPSRRLLQCQRRYQAARSRSGFAAKWLRKWRALQHRFWSLVTQAEIPLNCDIGGGLKLPHPNGVVVHPRARIGPNCIIFQQVTLGTSSTRSGVPEIGGGVELGAGCAGFLARSRSGTTRSSAPMLSWFKTFPRRLSPWASRRA